jgi:mannitol/fructose-specific phosphotransferase system IIA component
VTLDVAKILLGYSNDKKDDEQFLSDKEAYKQIGILGNAIAVPHALWIFKSIETHNKNCAKNGIRHSKANCGVEFIFKNQYINTKKLLAC